MDTLFYIESHEEFVKALKKVVCSNYSSSNLTQTTEEIALINAAKDDVKKLILESNFDTNKLPALLANKGWNGEKIAMFVNLLNENRTEMLYTCLIHQNSEYGETITNFDWFLKLVLGTSELNTLRYPLLQLILYTNNNGVRRNMMYDINKDMLLKTINVLENLH